jgi:hypothetical protein
MGNLTIEWHEYGNYPVQQLIDEMDKLTQGMLTRRYPDELDHIRFLNHARQAMAPLGGRAVLRNTVGQSSDKNWTSPNEIQMLERVEITAGTGAAKTTQVLPPTAARLFGRHKLEFYQTPPAGASIRITALCSPAEPLTAATVVSFPYPRAWVEYAIVQMYKQSQEQGPASDELELQSLFGFWKATADEGRDAALLTLGYGAPGAETGSGGGGRGGGGRSRGGGGGGRR